MVAFLVRISLFYGCIARKCVLKPTHMINRPSAKGKS